MYDIQHTVYIKVSYNLAEMQILTWFGIAYKTTLQIVILLIP